MRITLIALLAVTMVGMAVPAFAELQNVEVGGSIRIRGSWYGEGANGPTFNDMEVYNGETSSLGFVEQRTTINVRADFTDDVSAFIEIDAYNAWGDDFRGGEAITDSNGLHLAPTGIDNNNATGVGFYQGYIEMREAWGYPLTFKIGRQEIMLGNEWLVGNNSTASFFGGLSFDGVAMTYNNDNFDLTGAWTRLVQDNQGVVPLEDAADADLMFIDFNYTGLEDMEIEAYWIFLNAAGGTGTNGAPVGGPVGGIATFGATMGQTHLHTIGARFSGEASGFDWNIEGAYQFGDGGVMNTVAPTMAMMDYESFAVTGEAGYTFDVNTQPRLFIVGDYYGGTDDSDLGFNRLFSDHELSEFLGNTDLSNIWRVGGGVSIQATEEIDLTFIASYFSPVEDASEPFGVGGAGALDADALGTEVGIYMTYNYSEDLYFEVGYAHFFTDGDLLTGGARVTSSSTTVLGGADEDLDYIYLETGISF